MIPPCLEVIPHKMARQQRVIGVDVGSALLGCRPLEKWQSSNAQYGGIVALDDPQRYNSAHSQVEEDKRRTFHHMNCGMILS